jgi:hypothetical protein
MNAVGDVELRPVAASVTAMATIFSPLMMPGRYLRFCASVPRRLMCVADMSVCTSTDAGKPP